MDWQQIVSLAIVAAAALMLLRHFRRRRRRALLKPCGADCGCSPQLRPWDSTAANRSPRLRG